MGANSIEFKKYVDELWDHAIKNDAELKEGMDWCEKEAARTGMTFYEYMYYILIRKEAPTRANEMLRT